MGRMPGSRFATPVAHLRHALDVGPLTAEALAEICLDRIERHDAALRAVVAIDERAVLQEARERDRERRSGYVRGPLHGIPLLVKDLIDVAGLPTRAGSRITSALPVARSAVLVRRLRSAGLVILGKTATVEFAFGGWGTNAAVGTPRNPWSSADEALAPGGSSSGSAIAVAAGLAPLSIGTDTGGSVRIPASLCGISALKSAPHAVPRRGIVPLSRTLDSVGPMALAVADAALLFDAMRSRSSAALKTPAIRNLRVGVFDAQALGDLDARVAAAYEAALSFLARRGARFVEVSATPWERLVEDTGVLIGSEGWQAHRHRIEARLAEMDPAVARRFLSGATVTDAERRAALRRRRVNIAAFRRTMFDMDVLLTPTTPITARPLAVIDEARLPLSRFTRAANYLDLAAVSFPAPPHIGEWPAGIQLLAPYGQEENLLALASAWQEEREWRPLQPPGFEGFDFAVE
jgi:aspartyl-tRNA(Asn)/glutamyl-tRNA(Gln) amidotransferase subunit A